MGEKLIDLGDFYCFSDYRLHYFNCLVDDPDQVDKSCQSDEYLLCILKGNVRSVVISQEESANQEYFKEVDDDKDPYYRTLTINVSSNGKQKQNKEESFGKDETAHHQLIRQAF